MQKASSRKCIYCGDNKPITELSLEHIWPDSLGGDLLPTLFQTGDVCQRCNSISGRFVDGAFLKSWFGAAERASGWEHYVDLDINSRSTSPLHYMGPLTNAPCSPDQVCEMWIGPCGVHVIHFRKKDEDETWDTYVGGDPVARARSPGRVYVNLTTENVQWIAFALRSVRAQFKKAQRYIVNAQLPPEWNDLAQPIDRQDPQQSSDLRAAEFVQNASRNGDYVHSHIKIPLHADHRLLAKLALGLGFKILGPQFLYTEYAINLRRAMWERNPVKRAQILVRGVDFLYPADMSAYKLIAFPGAWVIHLKADNHCLSLVVVTPAGNKMSIVISDSIELSKGSALEAYKIGEVFLVLPQLARAVGPIPTPEYLGHILKRRIHPDLAVIDSRRNDKSSLPPCR